MDTVSNTTTQYKVGIGSIVKRGIVGGIAAGIIFAMGEMFVNLAMGKDFFGPLRLIGSMVLGTPALMPSYSLVVAGLVGLMVHMMMSVVFGLVFYGLLAIFRQTRASSPGLLVYGSVYGLALWVINFLIIAPAVFPQFAMVNQLWNGFFAHTFLFGMMIGVYAVIIRPKSN